jgi:hypothetical protein
LLTKGRTATLDVGLLTLDVGLLTLDVGMLTLDVGLLTLDAGLLASSQYPKGPATGYLGTGFSWFPFV